MINQRGGHGVDATDGGAMFRGRRGGHGVDEAGRRGAAALGVGAVVDGCRMSADVNRRSCRRSRGSMPARRHVLLMKNLGCSR